MSWRIGISALIFLVIVVPMILLSAPLVALLLLTPWDGTTSPFGNEKWGKGDLDPSYGQNGYWPAFKWLVLRNPVNNLLSDTLSVKNGRYVLRGNPNTGDATTGGFYSVITADGYWEYYWVKPYGNSRCLRVRIGWKIRGNEDAPRVPFVFVISPIQPYTGK